LWVIYRFQFSMLFTMPCKLSLVSTILWKKKWTSLTDQAIYFDFYARKYDEQMKCSRNYGCLVCIFSIFSWWALSQFLSLAYHEERWLQTQKKLIRLLERWYFCLLITDRNELAGNTRSQDSRVIPNDQCKEKSTGSWCWSYEFDCVCYNKPSYLLALNFFGSLSHG